jgi:hypothetical protein
MGTLTCLYILSQTIAVLSIAIYQTTLPTIHSNLNAVQILAMIWSFSVDVMLITNLFMFLQYDRVLNFIYNNIDD